MEGRLRRRDGGEDLGGWSMDGGGKGGKGMGEGGMEEGVLDEGIEEELGGGNIYMNIFWLPPILPT